MYALDGAASRSPVSGSLKHEADFEPVRVTPRNSVMLDDRVFAAHASFVWRQMTTVVRQPDGRSLRFARQRLVAILGLADLPRMPTPGELIGRLWDSTVFEIVAVTREKGSLACELVARDTRVH